MKNTVMKILKALGLLSLCIYLNSCMESEDRPERIDRLRAIGIQASPAIVSGSSTSPVTVELNTHILVPKDSDVTSVEAFKDEEYTFGFSAENITVDPIATPTTYGSLKYYVLKSRFSFVPAQYFAFAQAGVPLRLRYGMRVVATENDEEKIVGDVLIVPSTDESLSWTGASVAIDSPKASEVINASTYELSATLSSHPFDQIKLAWFVSSGSIENRRDSSSKWYDFDTGEQVIFATVRGIKTKSFAVDIRKVSRE